MYTEVRPLKGDGKLAQLCDRQLHIHEYVKECNFFDFLSREIGFNKFSLILSRQDALILLNTYILRQAQQKSTLG